MEQIVDKDANMQAIDRMVKRLKIKEAPLRQFSMKLATEYMQTESNIKNMNVKDEYKNIEEECINGLYKQHITVATEPKMAIFYKEYNYENLMQNYEEKIDCYRNINNEIINAQSKKQLIHTEKARISDMLSRQFASSQFERIKLVDVAGFTKREIEKLYKNSKNIIEEELNAVLPEEREILKDNHLGKLKYVMANFYYEKENENDKTKEKPKKQRMKLWQWIKQFFKGKQPKMLEEGLEAKREKKLNALKQILVNNYYETEDYAGCFKDGNLEDRVHIMLVDEANIQDNSNISERREFLCNNQLVKV